VASATDDNGSGMRIVLPEERPRVEVPIKDGHIALISPVLPSDRRYFARGIEEMSVESRYTRFGQGVAHFSEWELNYLTDVDQRAHVALGAAVGGQVAGVGRYIVTEEDCPEVAITVIDEFQNMGVGTALFWALVAIARSDGLSELCFEVVADNHPVIHMMSKLGTHSRRTDDVLEAVFGLENLPRTNLDDEFVALLRRVRGQC